MKSGRTFLPMARARVPVQATSLDRSRRRSVPVPVLVPGAALAAG
jgi:hypothetical protein